MALLRPPYKSTYSLVAASPLRVGVAKLVILKALSDKLEVGAVILFKLTVFK